MRTVSKRDHWVDDHAEGLLGLPVAEVLSDIVAEGYTPQVWWPGDWHGSIGDQDAVSVTVNIEGVVIDIGVG
jgi:hypothetical protein